jgi:hypothetical protein
MKPSAPFNTKTFPKDNNINDKQRNKYHLIEPVTRDKVEFACKLARRNQANNTGGDRGGNKRMRSAYDARHRMDAYPELGEVIVLQKKNDNGRIVDTEYVVKEVAIQRPGYVEKGYPISKSCFNLVLQEKKKS